MMIDLRILFSYFLAVLLFLATPGPVTVSVVAISAKSGFKKALGFIAGTNTASLVYISIASFSIIGLFSINNILLDFVKFLGSFFLLYFGIDLIRGAISSAKAKKTEQTNPDKKLFLKGLGVGLSNPKDIIFFLSFFPQFSGVSTNPVYGLCILSVSWMILDYSLLSIYALGSKYIQNAKVQKMLLIISGGVFIGLAVVSVIIQSEVLYNEVYSMAGK